MNLTRVSQTYPWGLYTRNGHRVLCSDGVVRAASMAPTADTFFSIPASVRIKGKTISGYVTTEDGPDDGRVWCFRHHSRHEGILPAWPASFDPAHEALLARAFGA
jgi:hypothetical protein